VARALVADPLVVLADEPTGNLDSASTRDVLQLFDQLHRAGQTLVIVTHDVQVAATADRMISMSDGAFIKQTMPRDSIGGHVGALAGMEG
jgi:putative ABC transport system ATP-binding protein